MGGATRPLRDSHIFVDEGAIREPIASPGLRLSSWQRKRDPAWVSAGEVASGGVAVLTHNKHG